VWFWDFSLGLVGESKLRFVFLFACISKCKTPGPDAHKLITNLLTILPRFPFFQMAKAVKQTTSQNLWSQINLLTGVVAASSHAL